MREEIKGEEKEGRERMKWRVEREKYTIHSTYIYHKTLEVHNQRKWCCNLFMRMEKHGNCMLYYFFCIYLLCL